MLFARHGLAPIAPGGSDSAEAVQGGRAGSLAIVREGGVRLTVAGATVTAPKPHDAGEARAIVDRLRAQGAIPKDASFERMLADVLLKAARVFDDADANSLELAPLHLHPTSYGIGQVTLMHERPLRIKPRLDPDSHDRHAVFNHRHGDSVRFPK
ncbi:MAG: hypothetical protein WA814_07495 [Candidatus Baltobacteraceae bacterium]